MIIIEKKQEAAKTNNKRKWHKPVIITVTQEELTEHIKAAAWSDSGCLGGVGR